ncbi:SRPBCC family protein [Pseudomonas aeruginosa]|uniref:SRPBCC family protein n=1 Tax=Pseudomonas aeruginosa TaxID=287 RepID=UPI00071BAAE7|nr:SRPBCC family protein [Pseudomonas aeruginosa]KSR48363.1 MxaD family protein [Pseudomonas aeruginosa]RPV03250.1 SRPBCC family protein [Pseudomonas aeruginosa]HBP5566596.1 SRPBCC family protein [Pseudomonas aeruginosa]
MAKARASIDLRNDAEQVWHLIGGFDALPDWLPFILQSVPSEGGRVRTLESVEGGTSVERLLDFSEAGRNHTHAILQDPAPVRDCQATLRVLPLADGRRPLPCDLPRCALVGTAGAEAGADEESRHRELPWTEEQGREAGASRPEGHSRTSGGVRGGTMRRAPVDSKAAAKRSSAESS